MMNGTNYQSPLEQEENWSQMTTNEELELLKRELMRYGLEVVVLKEN